MESTQDNAGIDTAGLLMVAADVASRAALIAAAAIEQFPGCASVLHRLLLRDGVSSWICIGMAGDVSPAGSVTYTSTRLLEPLLHGSHDAVIYPASAIRREDYGHLHVTRSITSIAYLPLQHEGQLFGALEIIGFSAQLHPADLGRLAPLLRLAPLAIAAAEEYEQQRQTLLDSVHRMSQLYDLEKSLNSTLDLDAVIAMIPEKVAAMLPCQAIHLWLFDGDTLRLVSSAGEDATVESGMLQAAGEGYVADMAEEGESVLITDAGDERFAQRNAALGGGSEALAITNALLVPLMQDESEVGVLEAVNREDHPFDDDDQFFCMSMAETISSALKNANLLLAERKLEILRALVHVSGEITSTLRLDRLLQIIVNSPQSVLPYERCSIALDHRGKLQLKAVSGMTTLPIGDVQVEQLHGLVRWLSTEPEALHLRWEEETDVAPPDDLPAPAVRYFQQTGQRALYSLPLTDDQGRVGLMVYESSDPDFLEVAHAEMIKVLASQATVAIRNAMLYREVPLISLIEPLMRKKNALLSTRRGQWMTLGIVFECVLFLGFCPLPLRISGDAVIAPQHLVTIAAPVDGNVREVDVHEGQSVAAGEVLGTLDDWQWRR
ncbi:MAG TPA: GAF domain-containing protein, partial [Terracidiphilus sp.]|nr:GAF domain-containing protein [Terracidiphilus sp.]